MTAPTVDRTNEDLASVRHRFPLSRPAQDVPAADAVPDIAAEPFGVRFFRAVNTVDELLPCSYVYDVVRQVAVSDDADRTPVILLPNAAERTTTGHTDGSKPRGEEFRSTTWRTTSRDGARAQRRVRPER